MKKILAIIFLFVTYYSFSQELDNSGNKEVSDNNAKLKSFKTTDKSFGFNIINAFPTPTINIGDITYDGKYLWVGSHFEDGNVYQISPVDGTIIKVINVSLNNIGGLAFGNNHLWAAENNGSDGKIILKIDTLTGQTINTLVHDFGDFTHGIVFHDDNLYVNMLYLNTTDTTIILNQDGVMLNKYPNEFNFSHGIAYDGCSFWITSNEAGGAEAAINEIDETSFNNLNSEEVPGGGFPVGVAWDGNYLWIADNASDSLYQIDLSTCNLQELGEINEVNELAIYPNPTSDKLTISNNFLGFREVSIYNNMGVKVLSKRMDLNVIDVSELLNGIYYVQLVGEKQTMTKVVIKN